MLVWRRRSPQRLAAGRWVLQIPSFQCCRQNGQGDSRSLHILSGTVSLDSLGRRLSNRHLEKNRTSDKPQKYFDWLRRSRKEQVMKLGHMDTHHAVWKHKRAHKTTWLRGKWHFYSLRMISTSKSCRDVLINHPYLKAAQSLFKELLFTSSSHARSSKHCPAGTRQLGSSCISGPARHSLSRTFP